MDIGTVALVVVSTGQQVLPGDRDEFSPVVLLY